LYITQSNNATDASKALDKQGRSYSITTVNKTSHVRI